MTTKTYQPKNNQTQFNHKMDKQALDMRFTKGELYEMLRDQTHNTVTRAMTKQELVDIAWREVQVLKQGEEQRLAKEAAYRASALAADYANQRYLVTLEAMMRGLEKVQTECKITTDGFQERAKKYGLADAIKWRGESVFIAEALLGLVTELRNFVQRTRNAELPEAKRTITEFMKNLRDMIESKTNWLLQGTGYKFNSSSVLANVHGQCKYRAEQQFLKLLKDVLEAFKHDLELDADAQIGRYGHVLHVYIG